MDELDEVETEAQPQGHMACVLHGHRVGVSYYDSVVRQLYVLELWDDGDSEFPLIDLVKYQANPHVIYTSTKTEESFLSALQRSDGMTEAPTVKLIKSSIFSYEQAWHSFVVGQPNSKLGGCEMDPNNVAAKFQFEGGYTGKTNPLGGNNGGLGVNDGGGDVVTLKKGPCTAAEDAVLVDYVIRHGDGNWNSVTKTTGLARCGKICRLRWANHLRPNLKKGAFSPEEEELIIKFHAQFGNKWAKMASLLPRRTDNEIKNYWNTRIKRRQRQGLPLCSQKPCHGYQNSATTPTSLTGPTTSTGPAFQFQAQSHFPQSQTTHPHSPLTSSCPTTPTYSTLPLFNTASSSFQRPTPTFSPTLRFKRLRSSTGGYARSPSCSASQLDEPATTQLSNSERFQLPMILDTSSSSPILKTQIDSDRMTASATSVFPMKLELPSNQLSEAKEPEITSDTNLANGTTTYR